MSKNYLIFLYYTHWSGKVKTKRQRQQKRGIMSPKAAYLEKIPTEGIFHVRVFLSFLELMQENLIFSPKLLAFFRNLPL